MLLVIINRESKNRAAYLGKVASYKSSMRIATNENILFPRKGRKGFRQGKSEGACDSLSVNAERQNFTQTFRDSINIGKELTF